jgi:hypothetical protein
MKINPKFYIFKSNYYPGLYSDPYANDNYFLTRPSTYNSKIFKIALVDTQKYLEKYEGATNAFSGQLLGTLTSIGSITGMPSHGGCQWKYAKNMLLSIEQQYEQFDIFFGYKKVTFIDIY